jgi:hypothetical protein
MSESLETLLAAEEVLEEHLDNHPEDTDAMLLLIRD